MFVVTILVVLLHKLPIQHTVLCWLEIITREKNTDSCLKILTNTFKNTEKKILCWHLWVCISLGMENQSQITGLVVLKISQTFCLVLHAKFVQKEFLYIHTKQCEKQKWSGHSFKSRLQEMWGSLC